MTTFGTNQLWERLATLLDLAWVRQSHLPRGLFQGSHNDARGAYHLKGVIASSCKLAYDQHAVAQEQPFVVPIWPEGCT
jgi:hypothetical protein